MKNQTSKTKWIGAATLAVIAAVTVPAYAAYGGAAVPTGVYAGWADGTVAVEGLPSTCGGSYYYFYPASSDTEGVLKIATAALLAGKKLNCNVVGCLANNNTQGDRCKLSP